MRAVLSILALASLVTTVAAKPPPKKTGKKPAIKEGTAAAKGFYKILVQPNKKWTLKRMDFPDEPKPTPDTQETVTVETYDVRKVGTADVARLRWLHHNGKDAGASFLENTRIDINVTQVAVTDAGLYLLTTDMDDAKIATALKGKPSRSDPPKAYKGTKVNDGRYLNVNAADGMVCLGRDPLPTEGECGDVCGGEVCISGTDGVVSLTGDWAPEFYDYSK